ncbi:MAG: extracellular solute-binding protein [Anaerolineae bacterium]
MKQYRSITLFSLLLALMLVLAACGGAESPEPAAEVPAVEEEAPAAEAEEEMAEEEMEEEAMVEEGAGSIWVLLPDSASSARWETDDRRFFEQAFEAAGVEYNIVNAEGDASTQQTQAEQAITAGAGVILMVNLDSGSGAAIIENARSAGVKIIDYDRLTVEGPGADAYVSFDNVQVGATMGETLEPLINAQDAPKVALLNGGPTDNNATLFREGYLGVAQSYFDNGSWEWVDDQWVPGWDNQEALVVFEQMLTASDNGITAVFAANDGLAGAVIQALQNAGIDPKSIPVSGQDATVGGMQQVLAGNQSMSVYKPIKAEAEQAAAVAIALLNGDSLDSLTGGLTLNNGTNDIPFLALTPIGVTASNIADTVIADGFRTWEEICVGDFEAYCPGGEMDATTGEAMMDEEMASEFDVNITVWADDTRAPILNELKDAFQAEYGVGLIVQEVADINDQFPIAAPAGEGPDILVLAHDRIGGFYASGLLAPIDMGGRESEFYTEAINAFTYEGELVGMPYAIENLAFFYNQDLVDSAPGSWAEAMETGGALVDSGDATYAIAFTGSTYDMFPFQTAFGGYVFGSNDAGYDPSDVGIDSPGMIAAGDFLAENVEAGYISNSLDWDTAHLQFETGEIPYLLAGPWALDRLRESGVNYAIAEFPDAGQSFLGVQGFAVNALSDNVLLAQAFLTEFVATEEVMTALAESGNRPSAHRAVTSDDADLVAFGAAGENAVPMPAIPEMGSVWGSWGDAITLVINGEQTAEEALTNGAAQIRDLIGGSAAGMVNVPGSWQAAAGCDGDWDPACAVTALTDNGDGTYSGTFEVAAGDYEGKVALDGAWTENYGVDGALDGDNITFTVGESGSVTFTWDSDSKLLTVDSE